MSATGADNTELENDQSGVFARPFLPTGRVFRSGSLGMKIFYGLCQPPGTWAYFPRASLTRATSSRGL